MNDASWAPPAGPGARPRCPVCGQTVGPAGRCPNRWCSRHDRVFSLAFAAAAYRGELRGALLGFKYRGERWRAGQLGRLLAGYMSTRAPWFEEFDVLTCMPGYLGPGGRRDWEPVGTIAAAAEKALGGGWAWTPGLVVKVRETPAMQGHDRATRRAIARGPLRDALRVPDRAALEGARVLVTDDVLTEGCTLREVAITLRRAGAAEVAGLVVARQEWRREGGKTHCGKGIQGGRRPKWSSSQVVA